MSATGADSLLAGRREDFAGLTVREQHAFFADNGFLWIPDAVTPEQVACIVKEMGGDETPSRLEFDEHWPAGTLAQIIPCPAVLGALRACYGGDIRFFKGVFATWRQQSDDNLARGRQILHRDYTGFAPPEDPRNTQASWCNVGFYFIDLDVGEGPLWVVPGSHRFADLHNRNSLEVHAAEARMVLAKAGDAVLFHCRTIHAGGVMGSRRPRPSAFFSYRPGWAAPLSPVEEWPDEVVRGATPELRALLAGQNDGDPVGPEGILVVARAVGAGD